MTGLGYQAVILAGGDDKKMFPLSTGVKALLPVANKPLLSYSLKTIADAGLKQVLVVVCGEKPAATISSWIQTEYSATGSGLQCEVISVPEECGTADALRVVAPKITSSTFIVLCGDLLTDVPINALVASHQMNGALATVMLCPRKISPASETKPGKPPKNVDFIGLDPKHEQLLFYASSPESMRDLKLPLSVIRRHGTICINSDLVDAHLYVFSRSLLATLDSNSSLMSLRQDLLPFLTQQQMKMKLPQDPDRRASSTSALSGLGGMMRQSSGFLDLSDLSEANHTRALPGERYMDMTHSRVGPCRKEGEGAQTMLRVHVVQQGTNYCARVHDNQSYGEVNREVADPNLALHLSGQRPSKYENIVAASTTLGNKSTVAAACVVGEHCVIGDKSTIKRSVLGNGVKLGTNVKVINSVLMDNIVVGDNCTIQNSILCSGVQLKEKASVKDCQVGPGYVVPGGVEYKDEVLAKAAPK